MKTLIKIKKSDYRKLSDEELIRRYAELQEYTAFNELFERFGHIVFGMCMTLSKGNAAACKSKTEEIFLHITADATLRKTDDFRTWLYNYVVQQITGRSNSIPVKETKQPATNIQAGNIPVAVEQAMVNMPVEEQQCIKLFYEGNNSFAEIAKKTGLTMVAIKELLHDGKEHLSHQLELQGQLAHIMDSSTCLSRRQLKEYVCSQMEAEEAHAIEHHLGTCSLCSMAADGMEISTPDAVSHMEALNRVFLNDHFSITYPQVHISSFVSDPSAGRHTKAKKIPMWTHLLIGMVVVAATALLFYTGKL